MTATAELTRADALDGIYREHRAHIYGVVRKRVASDQDAADITQDVFLRALRKLDQYEERGKGINAWLTTIALNMVRDHHRRLLTRRTQGLPEFEDFAAAIADQSPEGDPEATALDRVFIQCLPLALAACTPRQREALRHRFIDGLTIKQTAARMGTSRQAVAALTWKAITTLRGDRS
jgi:RNA polymerase sigma-70 factor (ECF subfamily)